MHRNYSFYRNYHRGWEIRDDCTACILSVFLYWWYLATINFFLSLTSHSVSHLFTTFKAEDLIKPCLKSFKSSLHSFPLWDSLHVMKYNSKNMVGNFTINLPNNWVWEEIIITGVLLETLLDVSLDTPQIFIGEWRPSDFC